MKVNDRHCSFYYENEVVGGEIDFKMEETALLIIDLQNYFVRRPEYDETDPAQSKEKTRWQEFYDTIEGETIPNNQKILEAFRQAGALVCFAKIESQLSSGEDRSLSQKESGFNNLLLPRGSEEAAIIDELCPIENEIVVTKTTDSALTGTNLRLMLANCGIKHVIVTGVFTDQCVSGTVRSLADESFKVWLVEDACMAGNKEIQNFELAILNNIYCNVINTEEVLRNIKE